MRPMIVFATTRFEGVHCWPDAPDEVGFLRDLHRHVFHVRVEVAITKDRQREFLMLKREVQVAVNALKKKNDTTTWSCETWARRIGEGLGAYSVTVAEDGENGATVWMEDEPQCA